MRQRKRSGYLFLIAMVLLIGGVVAVDQRVSAKDGPLSVTQAQAMCPECTQADEFASQYLTPRLEGVAFDSADSNGSTIVLTAGHALNAWFKMPDGTFASGSAQTDSDTIEVPGVLSADIIKGTMLDLPYLTPHLVQRTPLVSVTTEIVVSCIDGGGPNTISVVVMHPLDSPLTVGLGAQSACNGV